MSHYNVDYGQMTDTEKHEKAIADCKEYLGESHFNYLCDIIRLVSDMKLEDLRLLLCLAGIQGYAVTAIFNHCFPENKGV